jgi:ABC-type phosphate transport system permease subunit
MKRARASSKNENDRQKSKDAATFFFFFFFFRAVCYVLGLFAAVAVPVYVRCPSIFQKFSYSSFLGSE